MNLMSSDYQDRTEPHTQLNSSTKARRPRLQSAKPRNAEMFQDQVFSQGRAGRRLRPQSSKQAPNVRQRRGNQVQQSHQRQQLTVHIDSEHRPLAKSRSLANHDESLDGKREPAIATQSTVNFQSAEEGLRGGHS